MTQLNWARYWRNALADASSCNGILQKKEIKQHHSLANTVFETGMLINSMGQEDAELFDAALIQTLFAGEDEEKLVVKCQYRPVVYVLGKSHNTTHQSSLPLFFSPIVCPVWVTRSGLLYPADSPTIPRDLLSPQAEDKFTIATLVEHDVFQTKNTVKLLSEEEAIAESTSDKNSEIQPSQYWKDFYALSRRLFKDVCFGQDGWVEIKESYLKEKRALLIKTEAEDSFAHSILKLYDEIPNENTLPLFDTYAVEANEKYQVFPDTSKTISLRVGHSNSDFPLADAQRDALSTTMQMQAGDILPVNGPPGTGKTTFVLSAVASLWIQAALEDDDPPLIIAASTNNQAVTNVIDAFGKDFGEGEGLLGGRWLPDVNSYGGYFPSDSKKREAAKNYQTLAFYEYLEDPTYLNVAEAHFFEKAALAFPELQSITLDSIKSQLLHELVQLKNQLIHFEKTWQNLVEANELLAGVGGSPTTEIDRLKREIADAHEQYDHVKHSKQKWQHYLSDESVWLSLFSWLPLVARKKAIRRKLYIDESFSTLAKTIVNNKDSIEKTLTAWQQQQRKIIEDKQKRLSAWQQCYDDQVKAEAEWKHLAITFAETRSELPSLDEVDKKLDTGVRFKMFRLAVHFWEARWLLACRAEGEQLVSNQKKTGRKAVIPRWRRRMMLTPCIVSTFHSLPKHMTYVAMGDSGFETRPLCNEIDLLIVDEAGQVSPEVAGASFALAKKALVIGDIHQIEPVRSLTRSIDIGNLFQCGLIQDEEVEYETILDSGRSVINGSVMHIAQQASRYHYQPRAEPGMFLREHRRCYDEIISFCNDLCYNGLLIPKRGNVTKDLLYPAFGYLHIDGRAESPASGSRCNPFEAETLAAWLDSQRGEIEQAYGEPLEKVVGVVTPFTAQVREIETACKQYDIQTGKGDDQLTVGTVHSLQGAERKIVIFSQVYSRHSDGEFIDMSNTMLNVAVSRAKDCFLVFGDMDIVKAAEETKPRGLLAKYLFEYESNEILFPLHKRADLLTLCSEPKLINNAIEHDAYLTELLGRISHCIHIVSPWVIYDRMVKTGLLSKLEETIGRGVTVNIFTDRHFNTTTANRLDQQKLEKSEKCWQLLRDKGMSVYVINGVHSKLIMADDKYMGVGSFNWLSAAREGKYANMETSLVYYGDVAEETKIHVDFLKARIYKRYSCEQNQSSPLIETAITKTN